LVRVRGRAYALMTASNCRGPAACEAVAIPPWRWRRVIRSVRFCHGGRRPDGTLHLSAAAHRRFGHHRCCFTARRRALRWPSPLMLLCKCTRRRTWRRCCGRCHCCCCTNARGCGRGVRRCGYHRRCCCTNTRGGGHGGGLGGASLTTTAAAARTRAAAAGVGGPRAALQVRAAAAAGGARAADQGGDAAGGEHRGGGAHDRRRRHPRPATGTSLRNVTDKETIIKKFR
jgi:hypothetical protein